MADFFQNGRVTTFHNLGNRPLDGLEYELHEFRKEKPMGLVLPSLFSELEGPALDHIVKELTHVEYLDEAGATAMAEAGTVAVILPGAFYTLRETQAPPIDLFRNHGVPMAVATDANPGSSPMTSLLLAMNMASTLFRMTPEEALAGATRNAARALGLRDRGVVAPGNRADLAIWDVAHPAELSYRIGFNPLYKRIFGGVA